MDEELRRISSILKAIDELQEKMVRVRQRLGHEGFLRVAQYIRARKKWDLDYIAKYEPPPTP